MKPWFASPRRLRVSRAIDAFNAIFSVFPLVVLVLSAATLFFPDSEHRTLAFVNTLAPALHDYIAKNL